MRHVYLPIEHSDDDLALAGYVAECLESDSLYVTWCPEGYQAPDVETLWRPVETEEDREGRARPDRRTHGVWAEAVGTVLAWFAALGRPRRTA